MKTHLLIMNCSLKDRDDGAKSIDISIENGIIKGIGPSISKGEDSTVIDARGRRVIPGFIDVHIQGAGGADVLDGTEDSLKKISGTCARFGVTGFLATTVYMPGQNNDHLKVAAANTGGDLGGAHLLGIHLEGPFISPEKRGLIQPGSLCAPSRDVLEMIGELTQGTLRIMTIAPELPGNLELISRLIEWKVIASFGHSGASFDETKRGIDAGITHVTHLFNAMASLHHREPGPLLAISERSEVSVQIIADGVHIHPEVLRFASRIFGNGRIVSITDGMQAMGLPDGEYLYNGVRYRSIDGTARYFDGTLIGTAMGMIQLLQRYTEKTGCTFDEALATATVNPANLLGIERRKGKIEIGADADLVLLEADQTVFATIVDGKIVYQAH
jgi:N-acetylglucosamine-6-phosphate deacetylase